MKHDKAKNLSNPGKKDDPELVRLNKYISNAGICSRRDADILIQEGKVTVNGNVVTELGHKIHPKDTVLVNGKKTERKRYIYILLNKPKGFITTTEDPENRKTVMDLVKNATPERIYPVGRLDRNTSGLLIMTNDGELANDLTHPSRMISKVYSVKLDRAITQEDMNKLTQGVELEDGVAFADEVALINDKDRSEVGVRLHSGRNRVIRRMFEALGYTVDKLDRVMFGMLTKKDLPRGKWRFLSEKEVRLLKYRK